MSGRDLTSGFTDEIAAAARRAFVLTDAEFDSGTLRLWTGRGDLVWDANTYTGAGGILEIQVPNEIGDVRAPGSQIVLSGLDPSIIATADAENYQGRRVTIRLGFFDSAGAIVDDPDILGRGFIDVMEPTDEGATARIAVSIENRLAALERSNDRRWTSEDQKLRYAGDKGFDFVPALQNVEIPWGKPGATSSLGNKAL